MSILKEVHNILYMKKQTLIRILLLSACIFCLPWVAFAADQPGLQSLFERAQELQKKKDFPAAIAAYEEVIAFTPSAEPDSLVSETLAEGLLQLLYCYIFDNRREDAANYFTRIRNENKHWIVRNSPRDIEICTAYALYEAAFPNRAAALIDTTLARPDGNRSPGLLYVDYGISSVIYNQVGEIRKAIECNNRSLDILRTMPDKSKMAFVLGNLVYQYQQVGEFDHALAAYDSLIASGQGEKNPYGLSAAEINIVHLFDEWGMEDEVHHHLDKARQAAVRSGIPDAYLRVDNMAAYYALLEKDYPAAAMLIDSIETRMPDRSQHSFYHRFYDNFSTVLAIGIAPRGDRSYHAAVLREIEALATRPADNSVVQGCRLLGNALADRGEDDFAIRAYLICVDYLARNNLFNQQRNIYYSLATLYSRTGRHAEACRYYQMAYRANELFTERRNAGLISQFRVKYRTLEKEQENQLLNTEVALKQRTIRYNIIIIVSLLLVGGLFVIWFLMRHRVLSLQHELDVLCQAAAHRQLQEKESQLRQVTDERTALDIANEKLREELMHNEVDTTQQEIINRNTARIFTAEKEQDFRYQFGKIHPAFLSNLRNACPTITNSEELHAMLIRLQLTTDDAAFALGINRASVHTSRSRLRKKIGLPKDKGLEDYLRNL